jgi:hypothetical protein
MDVHRNTKKVNQESDNNVPKCMDKQKNSTGVNEKAESL